MVAQKGKDMLLKLDTGASGNFTTVAGLRSRRIAFNSETVDVTDFESTGRWRELLEVPAFSGLQSTDREYSRMRSLTKRSGRRSSAG